MLSKIRQPHLRSNSIARNESREKKKARFYPQPVCRSSVCNLSTESFARERDSIPEIVIQVSVVIGDEFASPFRKRF